jgi:hypothetical protein
MVSAEKIFELYCSPFLSFYCFVGLWQQALKGRFFPSTKSEVTAGIFVPILLSLFPTFTFAFFVSLFPSAKPTQLNTCETSDK